MRIKLIISVSIALIIGGGIWFSFQPEDEECDETDVGCGDMEIILQPGEAAPTLHSIWSGMFTGCGIICHNPDASDTTELGPDFSTPESFYLAAVGKTINTDYPEWRNMMTSSCFEVPLIDDSNAANSLLLATINGKAHEKMLESHNCTSSYNLHNVISSVVSVIDDEQLQLLQRWVDEGVKK